MKNRKFTKEERIKILSHIRELLSQSKDSDWITSQLTERGFTMSNGDPMSLEWVRAAIVKIRNEAVKGTQAQQGTRIPPTVVGILRDEALTDAQKIRMLTAYAGV